MLSENIKKIRINKGLGLNETARKAGISGSYLSDIENGKKENPTVTTLNKIADALEVPLDYLTRKSVKAVIEDNLEELGITFEELSNKTKIPIAFFDSLDDIIPDEGDYERIQVIAHTLNIEPADLANALHKQEPPIAPEKLKEWDDKYNGVIKESTSSYVPRSSLKGVLRNEFEEKQFTSPQEAMKFILEQPSIMGYGGFDTSKMSDQDIIDFANELLNIIKMLGPKYNK
ncbi:XRE family transcriptional regulator [Clostridium botulinum]|nr:XRE family transcriptional regulator [Clostridium botulinum]